ncbi:hypothetical protein V1477_004253 [Vespula maculifrons]|uniref:Uncharacterized protein n=1 Tax=Vespula maculifrons TaxID=7453 RepID=A0ABD2CR23_VESMC
MHASIHTDLQSRSVASCEEGMNITVKSDDFPEKIFNARISLDSSARILLTDVRLYKTLLSMRKRVFTDSLSKSFHRDDEDDDDDNDDDDDDDDDEDYDDDGDGAISIAGSISWILFVEEGQDPRGSTPPSPTQRWIIDKKEKDPN